MLNVGAKAPDFTLQNQFDENVSLSDFLGKKVVLYFYPKDNTSGCTKQAIGFRENYQEFIDNGFIVIGISKDSVGSHEKFSSKYDLPFILLSDEGLEVLKAYGVWQEKKLYGKSYMGIVRTTYIINENGLIEKVYEKVKPDNNAVCILNDYKKGE